MSGLALCKQYYETYVRPMIEAQFGAYADKIAVGLVGEGSDCFGYDDELSRDHDWGPDVCLWVTDETYEQIGEALQQAYEQLPDTFLGYKRTRSARGNGRRGVLTISTFYRRLLQADEWEEIDWQQVSDASLAAAVNGDIFRDEEGVFSAFREKLLQGYPEQIRYLKLAESVARFSQTGQYNYARMLGRGDSVTARILLADCMKEAMKLQHYIEGKYPPHNKWLYRSLQDTAGGKKLCEFLNALGGLQGNGRIEKAQTGEIGGKLGKARTEESGEQLDKNRTEEISRQIEHLAEFLAMELYEAHWISDTDGYLDAHSAELLAKSVWAVESDAKLVDRIAELEFEAFDKVQNVGGRASCQNDWATFSIMRKSQYLTWNRPMLLQYLYDFTREYRRGHNLITEKYGRMMESTAPAEYERIKKNFPELSPEKKAIIEQIVQMQVAWMEEFSARYPHLADNARSIRSGEDNLYNTSYETYLRGEVSTYSDKMLELYGRYVVAYAKENRNLTYEIMLNSVQLYGYDGLDAAERFLAL